MRGLRQHVALLLRCRTALVASRVTGASPPPAATTAAAAHFAHQIEGSALCRWLHSCGHQPSLYQRQVQPQQSRLWQHWLVRRQQASVQQPASLRMFSSKPRGRQALYEGTRKKNADQGWYIVSQVSVSVAFCQASSVCDRLRVAAQPRNTPLAAPTLPCLLVQLATAVAMVGATYAAVPLYRMFCQVGGRPVAPELRRGLRLLPAAGPWPGLKAALLGAGTCCLFCVALPPCDHSRAIAASGAAFCAVCLALRAAGDWLWRHCHRGQGGGGQDSTAGGAP